MADLRIFLADDHAVVREGLKSLIDAQPDLQVIVEAVDGNSACELVPGLGSHRVRFVLQRWHLLACLVAGYANREQQQVIDYLPTENTVLREKPGRRRIRLTDDQRRRPAVPGKTLGRKLLASVATLFTPDTILRWYRVLIAKKWDYSQRIPKRAGRPLALPAAWPARKTGLSHRSTRPRQAEAEERCRWRRER